jgi:hypothetical protein
MYWTGFKGTPQRTGLNRSIVPNSPPDLNIRELKSIRFPGRCRSILADDGYLVAVSDGGTVKVVNLNRLETEPYTFKTDGNIYAEPALHNGTLYLGRVKSPGHEKGSIYAYTLGGVSLPTPGVNLRWNIDLKGTPVQALLPFDDRLYLNVGFKDGHREIHVIDNIKGVKPTEPYCIYKGGCSSTLVADPPTKKVFFLSESKGLLYVNLFDHSEETAPEMVTTPVKDSMPGLLEYIPVAVLGSKLFAVFGKETRDLCRIDTHTNTFDTKITGRVRNFAVAGINKQIITNSKGVYSTFGNMQENLIHGENVISGPVVLRDRAAAVGMRDGKLKFYKLDNLSIYSEFQVFNTGEKIQVLTAFKKIIAVGNPGGGIKLLELV